MSDAKLQHLLLFSKELWISEPRSCALTNATFWCNRNYTTIWVMMCFFLSLLIFSKLWQTFPTVTVVFVSTPKCYANLMSPECARIVSASSAGSASSWKSAYSSIKTYFFSVAGDYWGTSDSRLGHPIMGRRCLKFNWFFCLTTYFKCILLQS